MITRLIRKAFKNEQTLDSGMKAIDQVLKYIDDHDLYPDTPIIESAIEPETIIEQSKFLMFSSNNYLGLATRPELKNAAIAAIEKYGVGSTGSRLVSGNIDIHLQLEKKLADFKKGEDAIVFPTGFGTNVGVISAVMNPLKINPLAVWDKESIILSDELNHASIVDGIRQSNQNKTIYKHCDMDQLESLLKKNANKRKLIVTDSVFSMDGDVAPLDKISRLAKKYNAMVMVDEAHAVGVLGKSGSGAVEHFNLKVPEDITIVMGTLSKSIGCSGGYVVGSKNLIRYLRVAGRSYMFSTAMPPANAAAAIAAIDLIKNEEDLRGKLWSNVDYFKKKFNSIGYKTMDSNSAIIPVLIGKDETAIRLARELYKRNIFAPCVRWPVVPRGQSRIRFTLTASHTSEQIDLLAKIFAETMKVI